MRVFGRSLEPSVPVEPPPQAAAVRTRERVTAPTAAALILRMTPGAFREMTRSLVEVGWGGASHPRTDHGLI